MVRKQVAVTKRFKVMQRDGFKCCLCGRSPATIVGLVLEIDHIRPVSKGGTNHIDNLHTVCFDCNRGKHDKSLAKETPKNESLVDYGISKKDVSLNSENPVLQVQTVWPK